ncbi:hypothetical protein RNZ50_18975 [Paracoccaceae bacterium Fryx2]|nr:hypothetical protein [Paracoccaceae bacterium Fryx2]
MARYPISPEDLMHARAFLASPIGYHSPGLQRVLNRMRGPHWDRRYVLLVVERHSRWRLAILPNARGAAIEPVEGVEYTDLIEAERDIFRRRWFDLTGQDLDAALAAGGV